MATAPDDASSLLQRHLYVFSLPEVILKTLNLRQASSSPAGEAAPARPDAQVKSRELQQQSSIPNTLGHEQNGSPQTATSCNLCSMIFSNLQEQRSHVRSDLHRYNLRQRIKGLATVDEISFEQLVGDLDESISGSESSDSDNNDENQDSSVLTSLLKRQAKLSDTSEVLTNRQAGSPFLWFSSSALASETSLGIYRALFSPKDYSHAVDILQNKQFAATTSAAPKSSGSPSNASVDSPRWFLCMVGGGHFAAMVVALAPRLVMTHKGSNERQAVVLAHKTFHRYTTRRKQGGSQSANDNAKGAAHSAGAGIRRANEAALQQEIRSLLSEWKSIIDGCELVFVRATGSENRRTLLGPYEGQVLRANDARNRGFPFTTRRATQAELMRAFQELTSVKVSHVDEQAVVAKDTVKDQPQSLPTTLKQKPPKLSTEDEAIIHHSSQIMALIKRSRIPGLVSYYKSNNIDAKSFVFKQAPYFAPLHMASAIGATLVVSSLLTQCGVDPVLRSEHGKTAYELAKDRSTRDAFRAARFQIGERAYDWDAAGVGSALDPAALSARSQKNKEAEEEEVRQETLRRQTEMERLRKETLKQEEAERDQRIGKGRALGEMTAADKRELEGRGMTPEMRMKVERERRARAAEARMKK